LAIAPFGAGLVSGLGKTATGRGDGFVTTSRLFGRTIRSRGG